MYKAVIFDLDGTLAESKQVLSLEMGEALEKLLSKVPVGVMSGADFPQYEKQFLPFLPKDANFYNLFLFPTSSAECREYRVNGGGRSQWVAAYDYLFTKTEKDRIIGAIKEVDERLGFTKDWDNYGEKIEDRGEQITWSALGQDAPLEEKEKWDPDHNKREVMRAELLKLIPEYDISIGGATSIDILNKGINKTSGIKWLETKLGANASEMLYVGDALFEGGNDSVVTKTGIQTKQVSGPQETKKIIEDLLDKYPI
jgi:phosphomannomutase